MLSYSSTAAAPGGRRGPQLSCAHKCTATGSARSWYHRLPAALAAAHLRLAHTVTAAVKGSGVETTGSSSSSASSSDSSTSAKGLLDPEYAKGLMDELTDQSQLGQRGEAWTIAQFVAIALVVLPPVHSTALTNVIGVLLLSGGVAAIGFALQSLGTALTPLPAPRKDALLVTSGVYGYMRHPMYGGLLMASLGLAAVTHDESRLLAAAVLWLVLEQKVDFEEKLLVQKYGQDYEQYQNTVKKFIPYLY